MSTRVDLANISLRNDHILKHCRRNEHFVAMVPSMGVVLAMCVCFRWFNEHPSLIDRIATRKKYASR
jgi:hypothetical protein